MGEQKQRKSKCKTCVFWSETEGATQKRFKLEQDPESDDPEKKIQVEFEIKVGECRHQAPTQMYDQIRALQGTAQGSSLDVKQGIPALVVQYVRTSSWPVTMEDNWCGEWRFTPKGFWERWETYAPGY